MSETFESQSSCSSDCGSCSANCSSRQPSKEDFLVPLNPYSKVKKVIGIVSGKGGVGKSFITSYLSVLMNRKGYNTGILDADITGPSIPKAFGIHSKAAGNELGILPAVTKNGIKVMSVNLLLETEDTPVIWRGPVIAGTVKQFWSEVLWEDVDYMFVDMPPGTGDVPLTVFQSLPVDGLIIVTSPQELVSMIVSKAVNMANAMDIPILGLIENYSYIKCGNCGEKISVFGTSHIDEIANKYDLPVLGKVPIDPAIAAAIDGEKVEELKGEWLDLAAETIEIVHKVRENTSVSEKISAADEKAATIKIAVTVDENNDVFQHFGKSDKFNLYEIRGEELISKTTLNSNGSGHSELVTLLTDQKVNVLICGGIGMGAMEGLMDAGILVVPGAKGDADVVTAAYLDGSLAESTEPNCDHHDHNEEACSSECKCHE
ncbi:P-loop NTPase [Anaerocolumna sedimenticola]|uniref:Iron-sulfur cluster carrier protein n=1 Tax=Anaerocolumna sedimenticola TaxID=2696063 RepID=A0A6P1TKB8_9FIRM|nr:P-loop NTPase [Anaerocolumna sedimenticola]QHQ60569.1 P-loop NTPase [Anaerocolumna sedimenticola]